MVGNVSRIDAANVADLRDVRTWDTNRVGSCGSVSCVVVTSQSGVVCYSVIVTESAVGGVVLGRPGVAGGIQIAVDPLNCC
jgi:hypothetical protein